MTSPRSSHTATMLCDGKVLVACSRTHRRAAASADLYDAQAGRFTATGSMTVEERAHGDVVVQRAGTDRRRRGVDGQFWQCGAIPIAPPARIGTPSAVWKPFWSRFRGRWRASALLLAQRLAWQGRRDGADVHAQACRTVGVMSRCSPADVTCGSLPARKMWVACVVGGSHVEAMVSGDVHAV